MELGRALTTKLQQSTRDRLVLHQAMVYHALMTYHPPPKKICCPPSHSRSSSTSSCSGYIISSYSGANCRRSLCASSGTSCASCEGIQDAIHHDSWVCGHFQKPTRTPPNQRGRARSRCENTKSNATRSEVTQYLYKGGSTTVLTGGVLLGVHHNRDLDASGGDAVVNNLFDRVRRMPVFSNYNCRTRGVSSQKVV